MKNVQFRGRLKFLGQENATTQNNQIPIVPGNYSGLFLIYSGTNDTGDDYTFADNGARIRVTRGGETLDNMALGFLSDWTNARGGATDNSSATGGAMQQSAVIPFQSIVPNAVLFTPEKVGSAYIDGGTVADIASGTLQLYAIQSNDINRYVPNFFDHTESAFSGQNVYRFPTPNILEVWGVGATPGNVSNIQLELDGDIIEQADYVAQHTFANFLNQVETGLTYFNCSPIDTGDLEEGLAENALLKIQNSASTGVTLYVFSFNPSDTYEQSVVKRQQTINTRRTGLASTRGGAADLQKIKRANTR